MFPLRNLWALQCIWKSCK